MHWNEKEAIHNAAHGDKAKEDRLTKAACYRVQCWAEYSENDPRWLANYVSPDDAKDLGPELKWVDSHKVLGGAFDYTWTQKLQDAGSAQLDAFTRGLSQAGEDLKNLPHDLLHSRLRSPNAAQGDANPLIDVTNGGSGTPPTATAVVTPTVVPCGPTLCPTVTVTPVVVPNGPILSSGNGGNNDGAKGNVNIEPGATPDTNEIRAGQGLANLGYDVSHQPTANSQGVPDVRTADLSIKGVGQVDVYTPQNSDPEKIVKGIEKKASQGNGVIVQADLSSTDMESIAARTWGKPNAQSITTLFFQNSRGQIVRFDRPTNGR